MNWKRNIRLSMRALSRARSRTLLSASGVAIGIAAMVVLLGLGGGAERAFQAAVEEMGKNRLAVSATRKESGALRGVGVPYKTLMLSDWRAIVDEIDCVERAAPISMAQFDVRYGKRTLSSTAVGTTPEFLLTNNTRLVAGRFFTRDEGTSYGRVAVIGAHVVRELFLGEHALGERLLIGGVPFIVIGILQEKGADPTGSDEDNRILVPVLTAQRRLTNVDHLDRIFVQTRSRQMLSVAEREVRGLLRRRHGLDSGQADDFTLRTQEALLATLKATDRSLSRLLLGLATLTLGSASVGLLATSLLSVRERHGEIGLRLTVGAQPRHVLFQFLAETVAIAALGAFAGLLAGGLGIILGEMLMGWRLALTWEAVIYPFLVSTVISLVFGAYPAWRAARLDPIVALRSQ